MDTSFGSPEEQLEALAVVAGMRTPFVKAFGPLAHVSADELGRVALAAVLTRSGIPPSAVGEVTFGNVASPADASNVARVIALQAGIPADRIAQTVNRNCASGMEAVISAWSAIRERRANVVVAGGTESMSSIPLLVDPRLQDILVESAHAKSFGAKLKALSKVRPAMLKPVVAVQLGLTDPTCGLNMGQTAENLAREFSISRTAQDEFALRSHKLASEAWQRCFYKGEVAPVTTSTGVIDKDVGPRAGQTLEALAKLRPYFQKKDGTVTVGNSCSITDGAAAVVLASANHAKASGWEPLGYIRGYAIAGLDPSRMGLGPVFAAQKLLAKTGMKLSDFDLFEINEAFAAQVLACLSAFKSSEFAKREFHLDAALGEIPLERLNVNGGAIALGHPVGTSGTRLILTLLRALREKGLKRGLATLCVGGGQGFAVWVETTLD